MNVMTGAPRFGRPVDVGFGLGSVEEGGSVGVAKSCRVSSAYSHRTGLSAVLRIRVSMVRFRPWPPFSSFDFHEFSGITRGLSGAILPRNRLTRGLSGIGPFDAPRGERLGVRARSVLGGLHHEYRPAPASA